MINEPKCENYNISTVRTSSETHLHSKDHFHKNPLEFGICDNFETDHKILVSKAVCNKTTNIYRQNLILDGYNVVCELEDVLKSGH